MRIGPVTKTLINAQTYNANTVVEITNALKGVQWVSPPLFTVKMTEVDGSKDLQIFLQTSPDQGTTKHNFAQTALQTGSANECLNPGNGVAANSTCYGLPWGTRQYAAMTFNASGGNWTVTLKAHGQALHGSGK